MSNKHRNLTPAEIAGAFFPTAEEWKTPLYLLLDVVLHDKGQSSAKLPIDMVVRNVSVYQPIKAYEEK